MFDSLCDRCTDALTRKADEHIIEHLQEFWSLSRTYELGSEKFYEEAGGQPCFVCTSMLASAEKDIPSDGGQSDDNSVLHHFFDYGQIKERRHRGFSVEWKWTGEGGDGRHRMTFRLSADPGSFYFFLFLH